MKIGESKKAFICFHEGAYTTRNAPAPETGGEIVASPIAGPVRTILQQYCRFAARATRITLMITVL
jgi:hypothetical protein